MASHGSGGSGSGFKNLAALPTSADLTDKKKLLAQTGNNRKMIALFICHVKKNLDAGADAVLYPTDAEGSRLACGRHLSEPTHSIPAAPGVILLRCFGYDQSPPLPLQLRCRRSHDELDGPNVVLGRPASQRIAKDDSSLPPQNDEQHPVLPDVKGHQPPCRRCETPE